MTLYYYKSLFNFFVKEPLIFMILMVLYVSVLEYLVQK